MLLLSSQFRQKGKNLQPNTPLYGQPLDFRPLSLNCLGALRDCAVVGAPGLGSIPAVVGSVGCWFPPCSERFSTGSPVSPLPLHKNQHLQIPI